MDSVAAKAFLISKVVEEAMSEHIPLSEVEKKMLHFTEVQPSLPDIYEVNAEFDRSYDSAEYEAKISALLKKARARDRSDSLSQEQQWKDSLEALRKEDHYILVMVDQAFGAGSAAGQGSRFRDLLIYTAIGVGLVLIAMWKAWH